jgi:uncharacterized membrane protein
MSASTGKLRQGGLDWWLVGALAATWAIVVGRLAIQRHLAFKTGFDLGVYSHVIWTTSQGRPFYNSLVEGTTNFLSHHFVPLLAVLSPLYGIWPDARILLGAQAAILAAGAFPLYAFARRRLGRPIALLVIFAYLLYPALQYIALQDFHEIALAVPLLLGAGAALLDRRTRAMLCLLALALLVKEEVVLIAAAFGLYAMLFQRRWRLGLGLLLGSILWTWLVFRVFMPAAGHSGASPGFLWRYQALGNTPGEIAHTLFTQPGTLYQVMFTMPKAVFAWQLLAPLGLLPLVGLPAFLLALVPAGYLLLSDYVFQTSIQHHYTATVIPFLFLATVVALQIAKNWRRELEVVGAAILVVCSLLGAWLLSPFPGARSATPTDFQVTKDAKAARELLKRVPGDASVAADSYFQPWLAHRWRIADLGTVPFEQFTPLEAPDYLVTGALSPEWVGPPQYPWLVGDTGANPLRVPRFEQIASTPGGIGLWKRRAAEEDVRLTRYDQAFDHGLTLVAAGLPPEAPGWGPTIRTSPGSTLPVWMAWKAAKPINQRITFSLHLVGSDGRTVAQADSEMGSGHFPTPLWHTWNEAPIVADRFDIALSPDLPAGRYPLLAGAFESETVSALSRPGGSQWVQLAVLEVSE